MFRKNSDGVWVTQDSIELSLYQLECSIPDAIDHLNQIRSEAIAKGMVGEGTIDFRSDSDWYDGAIVRVHYNFSRSLNDREQAQQEKIEAEQKAKEAEKRKAAAEKRKLKKDPDYLEYQRLKAKFER